MPTDKRHTVDIVSTDVYEKLKVVAADKGLTLKELINGILENSFTVKKIFDKAFPGLEILTYNDKEIYVKDTNLNNRVYTITAKDDTFSCNECDSSLMCEHIAYTLTRPDIINKLKES